MILPPFWIAAKKIFYELLQHKHSYFIVLAALSLIVHMKERCQCKFLFFLFFSLSKNDPPEFTGVVQKLQDVLLVLNGQL